VLQEQIKKELTESLKSGDQLKRLVLGTLLTAIKNRELSKRTHLSKDVTDTIELEKQSRLNDEEVLEVIVSEVKKRKDSVEQFTAGGRKDLAEKEEAEEKILKAYLPEQLSDEVVREEIKKAIESSGAKEPKEMGKVMALVMPKLKGRADGSVISRIAKELLG